MKTILYVLLISLGVFILMVATTVTLQRNPHFGEELVTLLQPWVNALFTPKETGAPDAVSALKKPIAVEPPARSPWLDVDVTLLNDKCIEIYMAKYPAASTSRAADVCTCVIDEVARTFPDGPKTAVRAIESRIFIDCVTK